jgi:hypothetical protein
MMVGAGALDAAYGDRDRASFGCGYPAFLSLIPEMKLQMLGGAT